MRCALRAYSPAEGAAEYTPSAAPLYSLCCAAMPTKELLHCRFCQSPPPPPQHTHCLKHRLPNVRPFLHHQSPSLTHDPPHAHRTVVPAQRHHKLIARGEPNCRDVAGVAAKDLSKQTKNQSKISRKTVDKQWEKQWTNQSQISQNQSKLGQTSVRNQLKIGQRSDLRGLPRRRRGERE